MGASGVAGAALAASACGVVPYTVLPPSNIVKRAPQADVPTLNELLAIEYQLGYAWSAAVPFMSGRVQQIAIRFFQAEVEHFAALYSLIRSARAQPPGPKPRYSIGHPGPPHEMLMTLHKLEAKAVRIYSEAIPKLTNGKIRAAAASIMASEAQHIALLRSELGMDPVPAALVTGSE